MALAGALEIQIFAEIARLRDDMNKAQSVVKSSMSSIEKSVSTAKSALGQLGIGLGVGYFVSLIKGTIDAADAMNDLSQRVGINIKDLATWELAAKQSGTTIESVAKGVKGLSVFMLEHSDALKKAGITAKDANGAMIQLADLFSEMPDGVEKTALAVKLFGKAGMDMIPMLNQGSKGLQEAADKAKSYAERLEKLAPKADEFNDQMAELALQTKAAGMNIIDYFIPGLIGLSTWLNDLAAGGKRAESALEWLSDKSPMGKALVEWNKFANTVLALAGAGGNPSGRSSGGKIGDDLAAFDAATAAYVKGYEARKKARDLLDDSSEKKAKLAAAELKLYENALQSLEQQLGKLNHQTEYEKTLYQELHGSLQKLTPAHKAHLLDIAKQIDAQKFLTETTNAYIKVLDELDAIEQSKIEKTRQIIEGMQDNNEKIAFENSLIGMSADERELLNIEYERTIKLRGIDSQLQIDGINKQFDELAALVKTRQEMNQQVSTWAELSKGAGNFFGDLVVNGKSAFDRLRSSLKSFAQELIALFAQKWILNVAAGALGSTALGSAAASAGAGTLAGSVSGLSASGMYAGAASAMSEAAIGASFVGPSATLAGGSAGIGASAASMMAAIPGWGWAALAAAAVVAFMSKGGGPKTEGGYGAGMPSGVNDPAAKAIIDSITAGYAANVAALGGVVGKLTGSAFIGQDPKGTALTQLQVAASVNGQSIYNRADSMGGTENVGRSDAELAAAVALSVNTAILNGLKATDLGPVTNAFIAAIKPTEAGMKSLSEYVAAVGTQKGLLESLKTDAEKLDDAQKALVAGGIPMTIQGFKDMANAQDLTTQAGRDGIAVMQKLKPAFDIVTQAAAQEAATKLQWQQRIDVASGIISQTNMDRQNALAAASSDAARAMMTLAWQTEDEAERNKKNAADRKGIQDQIDSATITSTQLYAKQRNALDANGVALSDSNKLLSDQAEAMKRLGFTAGSLSDIIKDGMLGKITSADVGGQLSDAVIGGVYNSIAGGFADQITQMMMDSLVTPIITAMATGTSIADAVSSASIAAMVAKAEATAAALSAIFKDPAFIAAMASIKVSVGSIGASVAGPAASAYKPYVPTQAPAGSTEATSSAADLLNQKLTLQASIFALLGDAAGQAAILEKQHEIALKAADPSLRDLTDQLWGLQAAAQAVKDLSAFNSAVLNTATAINTLNGMSASDNSLFGAQAKANTDFTALNTMAPWIASIAQLTTIDLSKGGDFSRYTLEQQAAITAALSSAAALSTIQKQITVAAAAAAAAVAQKLTDTNKGYQDQIDALLKAGMTAAEVRAIEIAGMDASTIALYDHLHALQGQAAAAQAATQAIAAMKSVMDGLGSTHTNLQVSLLTAQGDITGALALKRATELATLTAGKTAAEIALIAAAYNANAALEDQITAINEQAKAADAAAQAAQQAANAAQQAADEQVRAANAVKDAWQSATNSIMDEVARIRGLLETPGQSMASAQAQFAISTAQARAGDIEAAKLLPGLSRAILDIATASAVTSLDLRRIEAQIAGSLAITAGGAASQYGLVMPAYATGTDFVPVTGPAMLHRGERVMTAAANDELVMEIRELRKDNVTMRRELESISRSSKRTADIVEKSDAIGPAPARAAL